MSITGGHSTPTRVTYNQLEGIEAHTGPTGRTHMKEGATDHTGLARTAAWWWSQSKVTEVVSGETTWGRTAPPGGDH